MGEGDQRNSKRTATLDPRELARLAKESAALTPTAPDDEDSLADDRARFARAARGSEPPLTGRTVTLDDPLTTSLLAEVTRHARTVEMSPEQLAAARDRAAQSPADGSAPDATPDAPPKPRR